MLDSGDGRASSASFFSVDVPNVVSNNFDGEIIIADYDNGAYYSLVETAAEIWLGLQAGQSLEEIGDAFAALYPSEGDEVSRQVNKFVDELVGHWIIKELKAPPEKAEWSPERHPSFMLPLVERHDDLKELLVLDPVHDAAETGWPERKASE